MHFFKENILSKVTSKKNCNKLSETKEVGKLKSYLLMNLSSEKKNKEIKHDATQNSWEKGSHWLKTLIDHITEDHVQFHSSMTFNIK